MPMEETRRRKNEGLVQQRQLLDKAGISEALRSIAQKILEHYPNPKDLVLLGIRTGGVYLAERIRKLLQEQSGLAVPCGTMDITLYRDDVFTGLPRPEVGPTDLPCSLQDKAVILVDDVLFTGRTIRAALDEIIEFGRPQCVRLAVLIDRGHREFPIQADYVGLKVEATRDETVRVMLPELGEPDKVVLCVKKSNK